MSSTPPEPSQYAVQVYPLGQSGALGSDQWVQWGVPNPTFAPLTISFISGLAVKSIWIPEPQGPMSFYAGTSVSGTPFYVTLGNVAELVPVPNDAPVVTMTGPTTTFFFYASSFGYTPFAAGTPPTVDIGVTAPIVNTGTSELPVIGLATPLAVAYGGSGTPSPSLIAGANVTITGSWPDQQIDVSEGAGGVQSVGVQAPLVLTGSDQNPVVGLDTPLAIGFGGTDTANPWLAGASGITVNGTTGPHDATFQWQLENTGVLGINPNGLGLLSGNVQLESNDGSLNITNPSGNQINLEVNVSPEQQTLGKVMHITGTNPGGSLSITLPAGTWLVETYASGLDASEGNAGMVSTVSLSSGPTGGMDGSQYTRYVACADRVTSAGSTVVTATLASSGGVTVNTHASAVSFVLRAVQIT